MQTIAFNALAFSAISGLAFYRLYRGQLLANVLSPTLLFYFASMMAFVIAPASEIAVRPFYDFAPDPEWTFVAGSIIALAGMVCFTIGTLIASNARSASYQEELCDAGARRRLRIVLCACAAATVLLTTYLTRDSIMFGLDHSGEVLSWIRRDYLEKMAGRGYLILLNSSAFFLLLSAQFIRSSYREKWLAIEVISIAMFVAYNIAFTNRMLVASFLAGLIFIGIQRAARDGKHGRIYIFVLGLFLVLALGVALGLIRFYGVPNAAGPILSVAWYASFTFDMFTMLRRVLASEHSFFYGLTWAQDIFYTYLPRVMFPSKPMIYGMTELQRVYVPEIAVLNQQGVVAATYPVGLYGETYTNFGYVGIVPALMALGYLLQRFYDSAKRALDGLVTVPSLIAANLYFYLCVSTLGFMRYPGQFMASLLFHTVQIFCLLGVIMIVNNRSAQVSLAMPPLKVGE